MLRRSPGLSDLSVSPLSFGGNVFGWTADEKNSFAILDAYVNGGGNFIDTADVYSVGQSESILGRWMSDRKNRDRLIIATKVGSQMGTDAHARGLSQQYILKEVEDSLKRLQTDTIDLFQAHIDDPNTPLEETLEAFAQLMKQGKVRAIGASNYSAERLAQALEVSEKRGYPRYESLQPWYNLYDRADYETNLEPLCLEKRLGVIPYYSLASGFLTGKYRSENDLSKSARGHGIKKYLNERGFRILQALDDAAKKHHSTPAQVSLAWLIARPSITAPIASATSVEQLKDLVQATKLKLDASSIEQLNQAGAW